MNYFLIDGGYLPSINYLPVMWQACKKQDFVYNDSWDIAQEVK
jgi:hypothetical protein